ncbi:hypothetical protein AVEN_180565-1 [Araneus ventricosus]|uniref:Uncharacterized protein n=1 Tax=Araneus ventricosus TaxID=182803 RepID=A0A4Y2S8Z5_ARAVE|nr:hypothetical protein AVEN_180565-1 [Araneus ventricosus]
MFVPASLPNSCTDVDETWFAGSSLADLKYCRDLNSESTLATLMFFTTVKAAYTVFTVSRLMMVSKALEAAVYDQRVLDSADITVYF